MSQAAEMIAEGFSVLTDYTGEPLTLLRSGSVTVNGISAVVDRTPDPKRYQGRINFDPNGAAVVEVLRTAATPIPKAGESWRDARGVNYRIQSVKPLDEYLLCVCNASE